MALKRRLFTREFKLQVLYIRIFVSINRENEGTTTVSLAAPGAWRLNSLFVR
jgi:hypothetical protein